MLMNITNRGGIGLLPRRVEKIETNKPASDLQFDGIHKDPESAIASGLGVSPILMKWRVGSEHMTYSNLEQARQEEQQELIFPLAQLIERAINKFFAELPDIEITVPRLWTIEQLALMQMHGAYDTAQQIAESLGLAYTAPIEIAAPPPLQLAETTNDDRASASR